MPGSEQYRCVEQCWQWPQCSLVPRPPCPTFVTCSTKSGGRPERIYHMMHAAADVTYCS